MVVLGDSLLIINKEIRAHWQGRTFFLISQIFYINLCDVRHILDLTFPYDRGIIVVMENNWCEIRHTDMSDLFSRASMYGAYKFRGYQCL